MRTLALKRALAGGGGFRRHQALMRPSGFTRCSEFAASALGRSSLVHQLNGVGECAMRIGFPRGRHARRSELPQTTLSHAARTWMLRNPRHPDARGRCFIGRRHHVGGMDTRDRCGCGPCSTHTLEPRTSTGSIAAGSPPRPGNPRTRSGSRPPTRSTPSCSTGCTRTSRHWRGSNVPAECYGCCPRWCTRCGPVGMPRR